MLEIVAQAPLIALSCNPLHMQIVKKLQHFEEEKRNLCLDKRELELEKQGLEMNVASLK